MKGTRSLARLRNRVDITIKELERLRNENNKLRRNLERAANQPSINVEGTPVVFSESGSELKSRIEACIRAIDAHIDGKHIDEKHIDGKRVDGKHIDETQMAEKQEV
jgi:regulator of replication initiation timing